MGRIKRNGRDLFMASRSCHTISILAAWYAVAASSSPEVVQKLLEQGGLEQLLHVYKATDIDIDIDIDIVGSIKVFALRVHR